MNPSESLSDRLGAFVATTRAEDIPPSAVRAALRCMTHNLLMGLAASADETGVAQLARPAIQPMGATLLATGARVSAGDAAFGNAALMNLRSQDDNHEASVSHPGVPVLAASLAVAETEGASGQELITAIILGYEVLCRLGSVSGQAMSGRGFRAASVLSVLGATAADARLMRLDATRTAHALGLATQMASGHAQVWREGGSEFTAQLGMGARNGVLAAMLARDGLTAVRHSLEGPSGFFRAFAGIEVETGALTGTLGQEWQVEAVTVKLFPVCAVLQGPMVLLAELKAQHGLTLGSTGHVRLTLSPFEATYPGIDNPGDIASASAAKMSAQFCIALLLRDGTITFRALADYDAPEIRAARGFIDVAIDPALSPRQCRLQITRAPGETLSAEAIQPVGRPADVDINAFAALIARESGHSRAAIAALDAAVQALRAGGSVEALVSAWASAAYPATGEAEGQRR